MKIRTIEAAGLKGRKFQHDLAPATVFTGPSFSGKTAVLDAVKVALLGYHPKLGKRTSDTLKLADGGGIGVKLTFDNGQVLDRLFSVGRGDKAFASNQQGPFMEPAMLDINEYFALSGPARCAYVLAHMPLPSLDGADPDAAVVRAIQSITVENADAEDVEAAVKEAVAAAREIGEARVQEDATIGEWLERLIEEMQAKRKESDVAMKQFAGLSQGTTQLKAESPAVPARSVEGELKKAVERRDSLKVELQTLQAALATNKRHDDRIAWLTNELSLAQDYTEAIKELQDVIADLEKQVASKPEDPMTAYRKMMELQEQLGIKASEQGQLRAALDKLNRKHSENMQLDCCPFCKSKRKGWQEELVEEHKRQVAENEALQLESEGEVVKLKSAKEQAERDYHTLKARDDAFRQTTHTINEKRKKLDSYRSLAADTDQYRTELAALKSSRPPAADGFRVPELETEIRLAQSEVDRLDGEQRKFIAAKATEAQVLKANKAHAREKARLAVFKGTVNALRELQQTILNKVFTSMMDTVNRFTDGILRARLEFRDGDIGYLRGTQWVSHECFSGTEEAVAYAGLCVALAAQAPFKLVVVDELGIVDDITKEKVLNRMVELVSNGTIDQFIGADVAAEGWRIDGLLVVPVQ
jgi:tetratricopeptide (TPR) repeat protein